MITPALRWIGGSDGCLELVDQRLLPESFVKMRCEGLEQLFDAVRTLAVRGAPAIGVAAAYGLVLALRGLRPGAAAGEAVERLENGRRRLASSRPTAVNLFRAMDRVLEAARRCAEGGADGGAVRECVFRAAAAVHHEDEDMCRRIGLNGRRFVKDGAGILTVCNAGALATSGQGTALSPLYEARRAGIGFRVWACETRPLLQGARLTAWELQRAGIPVTVVCDAAAGHLMKLGKIDAAITGADRITTDGDAANKIGTYTLSVLAGRHGIPFYVAAPSSTFDAGLRRGEDIPIEQRSADEVTCFAGQRIAPEGVSAFNPAFDVTPSKYVAGIMTEKGVLRPPYRTAIRKAFGK
jgi:methylthioribose-1-phosphate isomerase